LQEKEETLREIKRLFFFEYQQKTGRRANNASINQVQTLSDTL